MINKILVPLDVSNDAAVKFSVQIAKHHNAHLKFFHAFAMASAAYPTGANMEAHPPVLISPDEADKVKKEMLQKIRSENPELNDISHDLVAIPGIAVDLIADEAISENIDLIVLGSNKASAIERIIGTKTERVSRLVECPVLVIPDEQEPIPLKKFGLALDKSNFENEMHLKLLIELVKKYDAKLEVVNVTDNDKDEISETENIIFSSLANALGNEINYYNIKIIEDEDEERAIRDFVDNHNIEVLAMIYREHGILKRVFNPGLRKKLIQENKLPLLILK